MLLLRITVRALSTGAMILCACSASGQNYPHKPIRIVTAEIGGGQDFGARIVAQGLTASLGQQVIVDNRAAGVIPANIVAKAPPDGYTLLVAGVSLWIAPYLQSNVPYDPVKDFSTITLLGISPTILVVYPSVPANSVKELIALAKAKPGQLNYASSSTGAPNHLAAELFKAMAGVNIVRIPYKGSVGGITDVISGQVQLTFGTAASVTPHVKSGKLRALAVTSAQPSAVFPGVPPVAATLPGYEAGSIYCVFAPAKTPVTLINRLNREIVQLLKTTEVRERFFNTGVETVGSSPEQLAATIKTDMARLGKVIKDAGIRGD